MSDEEKALKLIRKVAKSAYIKYWCDGVKMYRGKRLPIRFNDGNTGWRTLTKAKLQEGLRLMRELFPTRLQEVLASKDVDNPEATDILIQLALFGEEVYGRPT